MLRDDGNLPTTHDGDEAIGADTRLTRRMLVRSLPGGIAAALALTAAALCASCDTPARGPDDSGATVDAIAPRADTGEGDDAGIDGGARTDDGGPPDGSVLEDAGGGDGGVAGDASVDGGSVSAEGTALLAADGSADDRFGYAIALSADGRRALVGVDGDDTAGGVDAGTARVFLLTGGAWSEEAVLLASDGAAGDAFGRSVALSADGTVALVGVAADDTAAGIDAGSARVFIRAAGTWSEQATLLASSATASDAFGTSVALSADASRALVGMPARDAYAGSARVFIRAETRWTEEATLLSPDRASSDQLGQSVALSADGSRALVGAWGDRTAGGSSAGSAHVFLRVGVAWAHEAALLCTDGASSDLFGYSVALSADGSRALVGAYRDDMDAGSARVFLRTATSWTEEATLVASDRAGNDYLGRSVALSADGRVALLGANEDDTAAGTDVGSARVFSRTGATWSEGATLVAPGGATNDYFGISVALSADGSIALVGARGDDTTGGMNAGSAWAFGILAP